MTRPTTLQAALDRAVERVARTPASVCVRIVDVDTGDAAEHAADRVVPTASTAKLLLLTAVLRADAAGELGLDELLAVEPDDRCGGSGLLDTLAGPTQWSVHDLAVLTAAVSDNVATNVLLRRVGLAAVASTADELGLHELAVHDRVRDHRGADVAPLFASGSARDLCRLVELAATGALVDEPASRRLLDWTARCEDHGLVLAAVATDPVDPARPPPRVHNKTGRDTGVRADVGLVAGSRRLAYAALAVTEPGYEWHAVTALRAIGEIVGDAV